MSTKNIIFILVALLVGIGLGYFLFAGAHVHEPTASHASGTHQHAEAVGEIYTCSMHPQIRQNEPGLCPLCNMELIPLQQNTSDDPLVLQMTPSAVKLANVQTTVIGTTDSKNGKTLRLSGKIQQDERLAASLVAHVPGRIEKLYLGFEGERVKKGQKIADIYSPDLITAQRELLEAVKLASINPDLLQAAKDKLRFWKIEEALIDDIIANNTVRETFPVLANANGVVQEKKVELGDYVQRGSALFEVINLNKLWVLFDAYEEDLAHIKIGDPIEFSTPSLPDRTFQSRVTFIDPIIDRETRVAAIRTEVNNHAGMLKPEMLVYGTIKTRSAANQAKNKVLHVPKSAVLWTGKRSVVYVKIPEMEIPSFEFRVVDLGTSLGDHYEVLSGLESGEEVVTNGSFTIDAAAQLNNQASMMNQDVKIKKAASANIVPDFTATTSPAFQRQLQELTTAYLTLKDALVNTDPVSGGSSANEYAKVLQNIDPTSLTGEASAYWSEQYRGLEAHTEALLAADAISSQREQFDFLSQLMIHVVKAYSVPTQTLYVQHCPMANDNQGADWLSSEEAIRNPYFGDQMLTCGIVKEKLTD